MPTWEAQLSDGRTVTVESDHQPTEEQILSSLAQSEKPPETSWLGTAGRSFATGVGPTAAFAGAFEATTPIATALAAETGPFAPLIGGAAGLVVGGGAAALTALAQRKAIQATLPEVYKEIEAGEQQHPSAAFTGELASGLPSFRLATEPVDWTLKRLAMRMGVGATVGAVQPIVFNQRMPTLRDIGTGLAFATIYGSPRWAKTPTPHADRAAQLAKEAGDASSQQQAEAVHANVSEESFESASPLPPQEGGAGVRAPAEETQTEIPLDADEAAERQAIYEAQQTNKASGLPFELGEPDDPNVPFASGEVAKTNSRGQIVLNRPAFKNWVRALGTRAGEAVRSMFAEEGIHSVARRVINDDEAASLWQGLSGLERYLVERSYLGKDRATLREKYTDAQLGHEFLRRAMQRLLRIKTTEAAQLKGMGLLRENTIGLIERVIGGVRSALGTKTHGAVEQLLGRIQENIGADETPQGAAPAARIQEDLFLPPEPGERASASEMGAQLNPINLQRSAYGHLQTESERILDQLKAEPGKSIAPPSFSKFSKDMQAQYPGIQEGQLAEAWWNSIPTRLANASGESLKALAHSLDVATPERVADPLPTRPRQGPEPATPEARAQMKAERVGQAAFQQSRQRVIARIFETMAEEALTSIEAKRKDVTPEDMRMTGERSWVEFQPGDENSPRLGERLTENAGFGPRTKRSLSKRVTVWMDKTTGTVHESSTYKDPNRGVVTVDPGHPQKQTKPLASVLQRYRPVFSYELDKPLDKFYRKWPSLSAFEDGFAREARDRAFESQAAPEPPTAEGEPEGPTAMERLRTGVGPGATGRGEIIGRAQPLTSDEAGALLTKLDQEVGRVDDPQDLHDLITGLQTAAREDRLKPADWTVISALQKSFNAIRERFPDITEDAAYERALDQWYDLATQAESKDFIQGALERFSPGPQRLVPTARPEARPEPTTARELTLPVERIPPTIVRPEQVPPGSIPPKQPAPEPTPGKPASNQPPPELSAVDQEILRQQIQRQSTAEPLSASEKRQAEMQRIGELTDEGPAPAARIQDVLSGEYANVQAKWRAFAARYRTKSDQAGVIEGTFNDARNFAHRQGNKVRLKSEKPEVLSGSIGMIQSGAIYQDASGAYRFQSLRTAQPMINQMRLEVGRGAIKAQALIASANPFKKKIGRAWLEQQEQYAKELDYLEKNWYNPELRATALEAKKAFDQQLLREAAAGRSIRNNSDYVTGRYEEWPFDDKALRIGDQRALGGAHWKQKTYRSYYHASGERPFLAKTRDIATLVESRIRQGQTHIARGETFQNLLNIPDPENPGQKIAMPVRQVPVIDPATGLPRANPLTGMPEFSIQAATPEHVVVTIDGRPLSIRKGYESFVKAMYEPSKSETNQWLARAVFAESFLKHNLLLADFFHPAKMTYYAASILGRKAVQRGLGWAAYKGGWTALEYEPGNLAEAVAKGFVTKEAAQWAMEPVNFEGTNITRHQLLRKAQREAGANIGKIQDALYTDIVKQLPVIGKYNKFIFDKLTRGVMADSIVYEFERMSKGKPVAEHGRILRDVVKDVNQFYGSIGKQGLIKSATLRDISRLMFLAPEWIEGLAMKEIKAVGEPLKWVWKGGKDPLGTIGRGMGRGLLTMLALGLTLKAMTKRYAPDDEGHKLDAWIPDFSGKSHGFWLSPLSVFAELTHDFLRLNETKPKVWDAVKQIGLNKLSPVARIGVIGLSDTSPSGEYMTTSRGVLKEMGKQVLPWPISLAQLARYPGHAIAPGLIPAAPPGAGQKQAIASVGIKLEQARTPYQVMAKKAAQFIKDNNLRLDAEHRQPTDEPSYAKLRQAVKDGDDYAANKIMNEIRKVYPDQHIIQAMKHWSKRPFTGSNKGERIFYNSLTDEEAKTYREAMQQKQDTFNDFLDYLLRQK